MRNRDTVLTAITPTAYCVKTNTHAPQAVLRPKPEFSKRLYFTSYYIIGDQGLILF